MSSDAQDLYKICFTLIGFGTFSLKKRVKTVPKFTVNPRLEVDLYYKSTLLEVGLHRPVLPLSVIQTLLLEHF